MGEIVSSSGWCAPSDFIIDASVGMDLWNGRIDLPTMSVVRGGIDFNAPRPPAPPLPPCEHRWERNSRAMQCDCPQCTPADPRGLDCAICPARLNPGDPDFDALYDVAPWWYDDGDDE